MSRVFADTSYWIALINPKDSLHQKALTEGSLRDESSIVTTEMVLVEVLNYFAGAGPNVRDVASTYVQDLRRTQRIEIQPQTSRMFEQAHDLYHNRNDKNWSLTDCASIVIMKALGLQRVLTRDHHFQQAGFETLLRE